MKRFVSKSVFNTVLLIGVVLCTCALQILQAAPDAVSETASEAPKGMDQIISLDLRGLDITDALKYLAINGGLNIVVTNKVSGHVTFMLTDVPIRDVFNVLLRSNNLAYEKQGDVYTVMTEAEYKELYGRQFSDMREVRVFRLQYAIPENAFTLIDAMKSEVGRLVVDRDSGTVLVMDTPEKIKEIEEAVAILEKKNCIQVFELKYALAADIEEQLKGQLDAKNVGSIKADERSNRLIVQTLPERMKDVAQLIDHLDRKTREVLIDAKILKITLNDDSNMGIQWEGLMKLLDRKGGADFIGSHPFSPLDRLGEGFIDDYATRVASTTDLTPTSRVFTSATLPLIGSKVDLGERIYFGKTDKWEVLIQFLETVGHTKILSNPKLSVVDNQEAKIHVGKREAYVTTTTTTGQTTTTVSEDVTFIDVGIQLAVTPTINADGFVKMKIRPEISSVVGTLETPTKNKIPIVDTSTAETTVMVKDNSTIIIGGLRKDEKVYASSQIPFLSKIPIIGNLLKNQARDNEQTELLILITPHVVEGDMLITGDFEEIGKESIKPYRQYNAEEAETIIPESKELKEELKGEGIKSYHDYSYSTTEIE